MYFFPNYHLLSLLLFEGTPYMTSDIIGLVDELYEMRLETLLSVQDLLQDLIETLEVCFMTIIMMSKRQYYVLCMVSIPILWFLSFISSLPSNSSRWSIFWITHLFSTTVTMVLMIPRVYTLACIISSFFLGYHLGQFNQQVSHLIYKCSLLAFLFPKFVLMACSLFSTSHLLINFFREKSANPMMKIFVSHWLYEGLEWKQILLHLPLLSTLTWYMYNGNGCIIRVWDSWLPTCMYMHYLLKNKAPTFLDLAGWPLPDDMDGQSLKPVLLGETSQDVSQIICTSHYKWFHVLMPFVHLQTNFQFLVEYFGEGSSPGVGCMYTGPFINFRHGTYALNNVCKNFTTLFLPQTVSITRSWHWGPLTVWMETNSLLSSFLQVRSVWQVFSFPSSHFPFHRRCSYETGWYLFQGILQYLTSECYIYKWIKHESCLSWWTLENLYGMQYVMGLR